jgi:rhodanese-related sulfurtransferase
MKQTHFISMVLAFSLSQIGIVVAGEVDPATVPAPKQTVSKNYLTSKEAATMKQAMGAKALMIDVRTPAEIEYVGLADPVDANVPYMMDDYGVWDDKKSRFMMSPNSGFLSKVSDIEAKAGLDKNSTIIVMCRSGDRSSGAANLLTQAGYTQVYSVVDGFEGDMTTKGAARLMAGKMPVCHGATIWLKTKCMLSNKLAATLFIC